MTGLSYLILETTEFSCMACGHAISLVWGGVPDCLSFYKNDDLFLKKHGSTIKRIKVIVLCDLLVGLKLRKIYD